MHIEQNVTLKCPSVTILYVYKSGSQLSKCSMNKCDADNSNNFQLQLQLAIYLQHILKYEFGKLM
jgi:hypothetical protein